MSVVVRILLLSLLTILAVLILAKARAAQDPAPLNSPVFVKEMTIEPTVGLNRAVKSFIVTVRFKRVEAEPSGEVREFDAGSLQFDMRRANSNVVVGGTLMEYDEIADGFIEACMREYALRFPAALPQRRKATRTP